MISIALVGRPNVGKSTLFNRLVQKKLALVHATPGLTRDRREGQASFLDHSFTIIDTPGLLDPTPIPGVTEGMYAQTKIAVEQASLILFLVDGREGIIPLDSEILSSLRKINKPIWIVVNKAENDKKTDSSEALKLSKHVFFVSAEHGIGTDHLLESIATAYPSPSTEEEVDSLKITIMGRPNVGKSTLINQLIGEERCLTADLPGVTRDAVFVPWTYEGRALELVDTAGIRRKNHETLETMAVRDAKLALRYTHVVILVIDASCPMDQQIEIQDLTLASEVLEEGRCMVLALNKWDKVAQKDVYLKYVQEQLKIHLAQGQGIPCIPIVAKTKTNLSLLMNTVFKEEKAWNHRFSTGELNRWLEKAILDHQPPMHNGRRLRIKYVTQIKARPPTFLLFSNQDIPETYLRYLRNNLRKTFNFWGTPLRFRTKVGAPNPYDKK